MLKSLCRAEDQQRRARMRQGETGEQPHLESAYREDKIGRLNDGLDLLGKRAVASVDTAVAGMLFIEGALAHGGHEDGEARGAYEGVHLVEHPVADGAGVEQDDGMLCGAEVLEGDIDNVVLLLDIVLRLGKVDRGRESVALDLGLHHVGREHDVDGTGLDPALTQGMVDLVGNVGRAVELGDVARDLGAHVGKDVEVAVAKRVVEQHAIALRHGRRTADDVDDRDVLGEGPGHAIEGGELADAKGGDEGSHVLDAGIAVGGVGWRDGPSAPRWTGLVAVARGARLGAEADLPALSSLTLPTHFSPHAGR